MNRNGVTISFIFHWIVLAVTCIIYGLKVLSVGSGTGFYIVWLALGVICLFFAGATWFGIWSRLPGLLRKFFVGMVSVGVVCFLLIEGCVISGFFQQGEEKLDYIIVLGAQVYEHGPSLVLQYRLDEAIEYLKDNSDTVCIVSGGKGYNEPFAEAVGMADYLKKNGVAEDRIILETKSSTTGQNILYSMKLMEEDASVGIVTNNFHMFRALQIAKKQGLKNVCGIAAKSTPLYLPNNMLREFFAMIKFFVLK